MLTILAGYCNLFLIESIQAIPGNKYFQGDIEFATLINFFFGPRMHYASQLVLYAALQSNAIQCLVLTAQATDQFLIDIFGKTCGVTMNNFTWICVGKESSNTFLPSPFGYEMMLFTIGFLAALVIAIPFFFYDLDKSVELTVGAAILSFAIALTWCSISAQQGLQMQRMPIATPFNVNYAATVGVVMLNLGCATVIPSWINIKSNRVQTQSVMWSTMVVSATFYVVIGIFFALGFDLNSSDNSLLALVNSGAGGALTITSQISVALYAYVMLLPSVPVNFIIAEKNLTQNQIMSRPWAIFFAFVVPILACIPLQTGNLLFVFLTWTSLTFTAFVNFILPLILYLKCVEFRQQFIKSKILTLHQLKLLTVIHCKSLEIEQFLQKQHDQSPLVLERTETDENQYQTPRIVLSSPTLPTINYQAATPDGSLDIESRNQTVAIEKDVDTQVILAPHLLAIQNYDKKRVDEYSRISLRASSPTEYPRLTEIHFQNPDEPEEKNLQVHPDHQLSIPRSASSNHIQLTIRSTSGSSLPAVLDKGVTIIDPAEVAIPSSWLEDFDPDEEDSESGCFQQDPESIDDADGEMGGESADGALVDSLAPPPSLLRSNSSPSHSSRRRSTHSALSSQSGDSLPRERQFKCPPFKAIPKDFPISPIAFCKSLLSVTVLVSISNLIINIFFAAT